ncbi:MAG: response regulator [Eubacterium sp.]|nr:response regulator [Eubacterium sp.]
MKSLRTKLTITIVLVVLASSVLLSFISYQRAKTSLITQLQDNYGVAAQKYALELTSWMSTNATIIDTLAAELAVNGITYKGYDEFHKYMKESNDLLNKNGYVYDVYFTYPDNSMVCASDFLPDGTVDFVHEREWYTTSALTGELFFSTPYLDSDTKRNVVTISKAVYKDDELLGVLAADIFVDVLVDMVNEADVEENSYAFLIDQNMRMIVHPNQAYDYTDKPLKVMDVPNAPYGDLMDAISQGTDDMVFIKDYDGVTRGVVWARMPNTGWYVCTATSKKVMERSVAQLMRGFVIAAVVAILLGVVIAILLAKALDEMTKQEQEYKEQMLKLEKQAADEANEAKSRFLADMSHEIRTPINAIIGMNEMILRESDNSDIRGYSRNIKQSGHNLLELINGILDFSKIEDGKMEIVPVSYDTSAQITYLYNSIAERARNKGLELRFDIDDRIPAEMYGDDTRINQIIMNLLTNAVKYTEKGSVTFIVKEKDRNEAKKEIRLYFEVTDTGIGIKEGETEKLFESFERLDKVRNRNIEGTGLGMTITSQLLALMGSKLKVESEYGYGSTFSFELTQKIENDHPIGDYTKAVQTENEVYKESFRAPDAHILVVDDTEMNILVIKNLLKKTGIRIDTALSGPESIKLAEENSYDLILMDQRMPGMDGSEAMREIRNILRSEKIPIICLTADVIMGARERYLRAGFDDYLTKPVNGAELEKMLRDYLPADKIEIHREVEEAGKAEEAGKTGETEKDEPSANEGGIFASLQKAGIDIKSALLYTGNDEGMYRTILGSFVSEKKARTESIEKYYAEKDWENYGVYVHSLKSSSKTLGAKTLSERAAELEGAAKQRNIAVIEKNHAEVMKMYDELVRVISENLALDVEEEDEVLEFFPE